MAGGVAVRLFYVLCDFLRLLQGHVPGHFTLVQEDDLVSTFTGGLVAPEYQAAALL